MLSIRQVKKCVWRELSRNEKEIIPQKLESSYTGGPAGHTSGWGASEVTC